MGEVALTDVVINNRIYGVCATCGVGVQPMTGKAVKRKGTARWITFCANHAPGAEGNVQGVADPVEPEVANEEPAIPVQIDEAALNAAVAKIAKVTGDHFLATVPGMVAEELARLAPRKLDVSMGKGPKVTIEVAHAMLPTVLQAVSAGVQPFLVGPAGSGKTTLAEQCAKALKRPFYMASRVTSEFKLLGFIDAHGKVVRTAFREAFEHGGTFLLDEVDASDPDAITSFNAALANRVCDFPDGMVVAHKDFNAIAAGNTYGRGADRQYVGRNQLDAATLDRFCVFDVDYDENLELQLAGDPEWTRYVQRVRKAVEAEKVRHVVSPRASIQGARMLAAGMERAVVEQATVWKGLPTDQRSRVEARMRIL